jgi:hypothetical protein
MTGTMTALRVSELDEGNSGKEHNSSSEKRYFGDQRESLKNQVVHSQQHKFVLGSQVEILSDVIDMVELTIHCDESNSRIKNPLKML